MITNSKIKILKSLSSKKYRYEYKQFLIEGARIIEELIRSKKQPLKLWTTNIFLEKNLNLKDKISKVNYELIDEKYFRKILNTNNPQPIMALMPIKLIESFLPTGDNILILDGISDPGYMGTLLRSAAWYGIRTVICSNECVDIYNPKVVRSAMGAHFYIPNIFHANLTESLLTLKKYNYNIIAATIDGDSYKKTIIDDNPYGLILGNEAHGINHDLYEFFNYKITIPSNERIESLNVAIAGSIILDRLINK